MAYPKSKAKAEKMALKANGTKVINVSQHSPPHKFARTNPARSHIPTAKQQ